MNNPIANHEAMIKGSIRCSNGLPPTCSGYESKLQSANKLSGINLLRKDKKELVRMILGYNDIQLPINIFLGTTSPLESVVKYLRENKNLSIKEIALILNRHEQTIWTTYRKSKSSQLNTRQAKFNIPVSILAKDNNSVMESVCYYLKDFYGLKHSQTASLLNRNIKTVWTSYNRYIKKKAK